MAEAVRVKPKTKKKTKVTFLYRYCGISYLGGSSVYILVLPTSHKNEMWNTLKATNKMYFSARDADFVYYEFSHLTASSRQYVFLYSLV